MKFGSGRSVPVICRLPKASAEELAAIDQECSHIPWTPLQFENELERGEVLGARLNGELVGFLVTQTVADESHILNLGVKTSSRRAGIAESLLFAAFSRLHLIGVRFVTLEVRIGNAPARKLYAKIGFEEVSLRPGYYVDTGEDGIIGRLELGAFTERFREQLKAYALIE